MNTLTQIQTLNDKVIELYDEYQKQRNALNKEIIFLKCKAICEKYNVSDLYLFLDDDEDPSVELSLFKNEEEELDESKSYLYDIWVDIVQDNDFIFDTIEIEGFADDIELFYSKQLHYNILMQSADEIKIIDIE